MSSSKTKQVVKKELKDAHANYDNYRLLQVDPDEEYTFSVEDPDKTPYLNEHNIKTKRGEVVGVEPIYDIVTPKKRLSGMVKSKKPSPLPYRPTRKFDGYRLLQNPDDEYPFPVEAPGRTPYLHEHKIKTNQGKVVGIEPIHDIKTPSTRISGMVKSKILADPTVLRPSIKGDKMFRKRKRKNTKKNKRKLSKKNKKKLSKKNKRKLSKRR